jgi:hypothetical protein
MPNEYGVFSGNPQTEWLSEPDDDRNMKLLLDFSYTDPEGKVWLAPIGSVINGASIPAPLWSTVGSPYTGDYRNASIVHDVACDQAMSASDREAADKMFYFACLAGGCNTAEARLFYLGVRIGAWGTGQAGWMAKLRPRNLLFRLRSEPRLPEEQKIRDKFEIVRAKLETLTVTDGFDKLETLVNAELK